ncbi:hypothetical protein [Pseudoteredinibacter isoporae]|uniref:SPOR domain-containing protein n=1 Tax=Pseudoteredinibacter isoporae TaxID=570281 RepID=A0A7X0JTU0_9GAMM|nr:hypothetical protein [Pseudoteredinibacter isoporae]MBB6522007.1 hypothetical protein [Pseudoteredinibacter isoporae]NHO87543.1 hypothetical protein [Pseudoteredinibacter isoporae]NIB24126.1 hypothetical protein [Pseudoteredinibacter isoporae]
MKKLLSLSEFRRYAMCVSILPLLMSAASVSARCQYYSFLDFGVDPTAGKVFRSSGVRMYQPGFEAAYSPYGHVEKDGFSIQRLGPFNTQAEAKQRLNLALQKLKKDGYRKVQKAGFPRVLLLNKKLCRSSG